MEWILVDNGIDPGIITNSIFIFDGKEYPIDDGSVYADIVEKNHLDDVTISKISSLNSGISISAASMRPIVAFELKDDNEKF